MDIDSLPSRLDYLRPVFQHFVDLQKPDLSEAFEDGELDIAILEEAVLNRTGTSTVEEAEEIIREDRAALGKWLSESKNADSPFHFILGWMMMGATQLIGVQEDNIAFLSKMLVDLPKAPPGREFGPPPKIEPVQSDSLQDDGNLILYVQKHSFGPPELVDICVAIDGETVIHDVFEATLDNKYTRYCVKLDKGEHGILVTSEVSGARLEETVTVDQELYACIMFFYSEPSAFDDGEDPWFHFDTKKKDWLTEQHWRSPK